VVLRREYWTRLIDAPFPREVRRVRFPSDARILITQFDKIGDVLCSTAAIGLLRRVLPKAYIAVAVQPYSRDVLINNRDVDEVLSKTAPWSSARFAGSLGERFRVALQLGRSLRARRFDVGIDLQGNPLNGLLMVLAGIPLRVGMTRLGGDMWLTAGQPMDWFANRVVFRLRLVERLTGQTGEPRTRFDPDAADRTWASDRIAELAEGRPVVVVCPTADNPARAWDEQRYVELGRGLSVRACVLFCHAPHDDETANRFERSWSDAPHCHVILTDTLGRFGAMLAAAQVAVSNDSAPMHLAVAVGTPVVAIFGPSPPSAAGPPDWRYNKVLQPSVICRACLWGPRSARCDTRRCVNSISVDRVERAVRKLMGHQKRQ